VLIVAKADRAGSHRPPPTAAVIRDEHGAVTAGSPKTDGITGHATRMASGGRVAENLHLLLFEQMSSAVLLGETVLDRSGKPVDYRFLDANPAYERFSGQKAEQLIGKLASETTPQLRPEIVGLAGRVSVGGQPEVFEGHDARSNRWVRVQVSRVGPRVIMAMMEDVTEARRAEAALRERNAFIETIIASSGEGLVVYDRDLRVLVWNPSMEDLTGLKADQMIGRKAREVLPETVMAGLEDNMAEIANSNQPNSHEFEFAVPQTGRSGWLLGTYRPHRDAEGRIIGVIASVRDITARHEIDETVRRSEELFRTIFDSVGDGVAISEPEGKFLEVNRAACDRLGYTRQQLLTMNVSDINAPETAAAFPEHSAEIMKGGVEVFETTHVRRDGTRIPIEVVARRMQFRGRPAVLAVHHDMTERHRSEEALREQARLMQDLLDAIPIPIIAKDREGRLQIANIAFMAGPGRPREDVMGKTIAELGQLEAATHAAYDRQILRDGSTQKYEADMLFPDGTVRRQLLTKAPLCSPSGEITGIVTAALDITDRYDAEQALRHSEERFRTLIESAGDAIFMVDPADGHFIEVNKAACARLGYSREEMLSLTPLDIDTPEYAASLPDRLKAIMERGAMSYESALQRRDGVAIPVELTTTMVDLEGRRTLLAIAHDISDRKRAETERAALEDQLRQAQKMEGIGRLAGGIAHDFNNLLTAIRGSASLALMELEPGQGPREDLEQIQQAADRAAGLTRQLLAFARRTVLQPEVVDLGAIVRRLEPMLERLIGEDVKLVTVAPEGAGSVLADPGQIEQVIVNLAVNASDAMPDGGKLTIEISDAEDAATPDSTERPLPAVPMTTLSVTDTGIGMDSETLERVFEPFFTTKGPGKGTGLGLSTVYGIVRQSGGTVTAHSEKGRGSTFTVHLPRVDSVPDAGPESPGRPSSSAPRSGTIIVVEDDSGVRRFAGRVLEAAGYRVLTVADGVAAVEASRREPIQLLLTDVVMPGMGGREVAAKLTAAQPRIRVLYMSGHTDKGIVHDGVLEADIDFLAKPFTAEALLAAVDGAISRGPAD
jgi:two-component system cell cycle sensor histidine kinase/response regulator CckA